ncbi:hypothetical protein MBANPS3_001648 [Mucor bainieri]
MANIIYIHHFFRISFACIVSSKIGLTSIKALIDSTTGDDVYDDQPNKLRIAQEYYTTLFTPDAVEPTVIQELLSAIPANLRLTAGDRDLLTTKIDFDDILEVLKDSPRKSSPGADGLPF